MTAETLTLTDFLLARIAEDGEWATWAGAAQDAERSRGLAFASSLGSSSVTSAGRVLAECEAKRRIIQTMQTAVDQAWQDGDARPVIEHIADRTLRALAAVYADHPEFQEEWRP